MSDKINGFVVTLKNDISEEHANRIKELLFLLDGVVAVDVNVTDHFTEHMARQRAMAELREKMLDMLWKS